MSVPSLPPLLNLPYSPSSGSVHVALVYDRPEERDALVAQFINEGLEKGQLCVYGTVRYRIQGHLQTMSSMIRDYDRHVQTGNLVVIDFAPFYLSATMGDFKPFVNAKKLIEEKSQGRKSSQVRIIGDAVELMFDNDQFDPCASIEGWWQENFQDGITLCTYRRSSIRSYYHDIQFHRAVRATHHYVVDASELVKASSTATANPAPLFKQGEGLRLHEPVTGEIDNNNAATGDDNDGGGDDKVQKRREGVE